MNNLLYIEHKTYDLKLGYSKRELTSILREKLEGFKNTKVFPDKIDEVVVALGTVLIDEGFRDYCKWAHSLYDELYVLHQYGVEDWYIKQCIPVIWKTRICTLEDNKVITESLKERAIRKSSSLTRSMLKDTIFKLCFAFMLVIYCIILGFALDWGRSNDNWIPREANLIFVLYISIFSFVLLPSLERAKISQAYFAPINLGLQSVGCLTSIIFGTPDNQPFMIENSAWIIFCCLLLFAACPVLKAQEQFNENLPLNKDFTSK